MRPDTTSAIHERWIAALEQRAARLEGEARRALEARLVERRAFEAPAGDAAADVAPAASQHPLRELVDHLARVPTPERAAYPDLPALAQFRQLWSALRADRQLQHSVAHTPTDAGPLNSTALASRAIALMRELSPDYLRSFLAYVDDLAWLEQLGSAGPQPASGQVTPRKRARRKPTG